MREEYRSHVGVIMSILDVIHENNQIKITKILFLANLPHKRAKKYLKKLENEGYIEKVEKGRSKIYNITPEGKNFLEELKEVNSFFKNLGFPL